MLKVRQMLKFLPIWNVIMHSLTSKGTSIFPKKSQCKEDLMYCKDVNRHMKLCLVIFLEKTKKKNLFKKVK